MIPSCRIRSRPQKNDSLLSKRYFTNQQQEDDDDNDRSTSKTSFSVIDVLDRVGTTLSQPLPLLRVAAVWVVILLLLAAVAGVIPALVATMLFVTLRVLGQRLIFLEETLIEDEFGIARAPDNDDEKVKQDEETALGFQIDFVTLALSILAAQLLVPDNGIRATDVTTTLLPLLFLAGLVAVVLVTSVDQIAQEEQLTKDEKLLNQWDKNFRQQKAKGNQKDEEHVD